MTFNVPMPCPHCQEIPTPVQTTFGDRIWAIYCPCLDGGDRRKTLGNGTIADTERAVIRKWNQIVERIILGKDDQ